MKVARTLLTGVLLVVIASGCGQAKATKGRTAVWHEIRYDTPAEMAGYTLSEEKKAAAGLRDGGPESLLQAGRLYSLRQGTRLFATLEVAEFKKSANVADRDFQQNVVAQISTSVMRPGKVDKQTVYQGTGNRQLVYVWFKGRLMHVLLTHDIKDPAPIVREAVKLK